MRPDVLMGIGRHFTSVSAFVSAMEESAYRHARDSFERYKAAGLFSGGDALQQSCAIAARLGWGKWQSSEEAGGDIALEVRNSPFAAGIVASEVPVCGPILGVLRAIYITAHDEQVTVQETSCCAQGHEFCTFRVMR